MEDKQDFVQMTNKQERLEETDSKEMEVVPRPNRKPNSWLRWKRRLRKWTLFGSTVVLPAITLIEQIFGGLTMLINSLNQLIDSFLNLIN